MPTRRRWLALPLMLLTPLARAAQTWQDAMQQAMQRARQMRDEAVRAGDQPHGAVVLRGDVIVGGAPSRVITAGNPQAHAEREALRDALRRLGSTDLAGCVLVSTSRPCRLCEAAAAKARIARMVYGDALTDAGPPA